MSNAHHAAFFNYDQYIEEMRQFDLQIYPNAYNALCKRTQLTIRRLKEQWPSVVDENYVDALGNPQLVQYWPLFHHGDGSLAIEDDISSEPAFGEIAYFFRILLAEYLEQCPRSPLGNWSVLNSALSSLGWSHTERKILFLGLPTYKLLKPNVEEIYEWPPNDKSPYWLRLHPFGSRSGWLPMEKINEYHDNLYKFKNEIKDFDISKIPDISGDNPVVIRDYREYLLSAYEDTISMYSDAIRNGKGLFMSITLLGAGL
jgi:hypothetical protein